MLSVSTTSTWTVCIRSSSTASVAKIVSGVENSLIIGRGQFISTTKIEEWTECLASRKIDPRGKCSKKHLLRSFEKTKSMQSSGSVFADRIEKVRKTRIELELIKIVDCFLDVN